VTTTALPSNIDQFLISTERPNRPGQAIAGFVLGGLGIIAWFFPLVGFPITITGLVLSARGLSSTNRSLAIAGLVLNIVFVTITAVNSAIGAYLGATGQLF
jgi:hypothetical protein